MRPKREIARLTDLFNAGYRNEWEYCPTTVEEFLEAFGPLKPIADPNTILFAEVDGQAVGFAVGFPDLTSIIRSFNGKLGPLKLLKLNAALYYPVNEGNMGSRRLAESFGGTERTAYTVYDKTL